MFIENLALLNFRNISKISINFDSPITILYGENGQGKTNIVESIYLLSNSNSFRTNYSKEMISLGQDFSFVEGEIRTLKKKDKYKISLQKAGKSVFVNDCPVNKISDYIGKTNVVCFSPEDVSLFKDSPSIRRHFLDKELSSLFPIYIRQLITFKSVLEERNNLLKGKIDKNLLEVLNEKIVESSFDIYKRRKWLVNKISEFATKIYKKLTNEDQQIKIVYKTFLQEDDKDQYLTKALKIYQDSFTKDKEKCYTNYGIHKDDFQVYLNEMEIDMYASQGQQRLISLAMKLAVVEIVTKADKTQPILILDDAFSELDANKKRRLLSYISNLEQVFITCTDYKNIILDNLKVTLLKIKDGAIIERSKL